jgi:ribose 1,5-bisphosphokinase PhnN
MLAGKDTALAHANKQINSSYACLLVRRQHWRMLTVGDTVVMHAY